MSTVRVRQYPDGRADRRLVVRPLAAALRWALGGTYWMAG